MNHNAYRDRIYPRYTQDHATAFTTFNQSSYEAAAAPIWHRLGKWLPADRNADILDVACGTGTLLYTLKKQGYKHVTGIDISAQQIAAAKQVCSDVHETEALSWLNAHNNEYDCITCIDIIEHLTKAELFAFVDALHAALRPGGILILQTPNAESPWGMKVRYGDLTHELAFEPSSLERLLKLSGFSEFAVAESDPYIHGFVSFTRWCVWRLIHAVLLLWNYAETGSKGSGVYSRVFLAKARKNGRL